MAPPSGRDRASLKELLLERTTRFEFLQAVRLFQRIWSDRERVGRDADPRAEAVRFRSDVSSVFPLGDVSDAVEPGDAAPGRLDVHFMGLATPSSWGSLPRRYAEEIRGLRRDRQGGALRDFLDLFNHRFISLMYRAAERSRPALLYESGPENSLEHSLYGVLGLATDGLRGRLAIDDRMLLSRAGLLAMRPLSASALASLLRSVFDLPAEVEQFIPERYEIEADDRNKLGVFNTALGEDLYIGAEITLVQSKFRVHVGPLDFETYEEFLPDKPGFDALMTLVRFAAGEGIDFDLLLSLEPQSVPTLRLGGPEVTQGRVGWSAWLGEMPRDVPVADALFDPDSSAPGSASDFAAKEIAA